jgi:hypothetical protein
MTGESIVGGCQCESLRFELKARPLFTHACHCLVCRRRSGTAFGLSTTVLRGDLAVTRGEVIAKLISPRTTIYRCAVCETTIYSGSTRFPSTYIVRGGTFDDPKVVEPGAHIWVKRKHPWVVLPADVPQFDEDYDIKVAWPREALERLNAANAVPWCGQG